jgi:hypothetical protein
MLISIWNFISGITIEHWTGLLAGVTFLVFFTGLYQIRAVRKENRLTQTLAACGEYDHSPNMYSALKVLWRAKESGDLTNNPRKYRPQIKLVLNHLDSIAIGVDQRVYIEGLARAHLNAIVQTHVREFIDSGLLNKIDMTREDYIHLVDMRDRWLRGEKSRRSRTPYDPRADNRSAEAGA